MTPSESTLKRLQFLSRLIAKEVLHLQQTDARLFAQPLELHTVATLSDNADLAERIDAFVTRLGRLQDTLGDKLLPLLLATLGEPVASHLDNPDNLDIAERLGWVADADAWYALRQLRNQMVHEYIEDPVILRNALHSGHDAVPRLLASAVTMRRELSARGWVS
jgi:hypothetical protein